ncbi:MAG: VWA domain-containing protein [Deltaproteobacteria bacterium]|nr:VWA domain-containing protein [Deltaproteobacteria bacterium]
MALRDASQALRASSVLLVLSASGCGSKTGLEAPDVPIDAAVVPDAFMERIECIEVPPGEERVLASLTLPARLRVADVMFVIDSSASMRDEIDGVRNGLRDRVVPGVRATIPEASFGVALFGEFPVFPHAREGSDVGPFLLRTPITNDVGRVEVALEDTPVWGNLDDPEAAVEAVYQVSTGEGLSPFIPASLGCATGGSGGACFRADSFHVVLLVTDAPMHNGPPGIEPIAPYTFTPSPHTYEQMLGALAGVDAIVIGLGGTDALRPSPMPHLQAIARDTGAVDGSGAPLAFDIGGSGDGIGEQVVSAIERLAEGHPLEVDAILEDRGGDAIDARTLVVAVRPRAADPSTGIVSMDATTFHGVRPGTRLTFELELDVSSLPPSRERREIPARVVMRESGRARLDSVDVVIVIPGDDGAGCP